MKNMILFLLAAMIIGCSKEKQPEPAPVQSQSANVKVIISGETSGANVNGSIGGLNYQYVTDSTDKVYQFTVTPGNNSNTVYAQYTAQPSDSISIRVLINSSQVAQSSGVGFAACMFVY